MSKEIGVVAVAVGTYKAKVIKQIKKAFKLNTNKDIGRYIAREIKVGKIRSMKAANLLTDTIYNIVFEYVTNAYLEANEYNDRADPDKFDSYLQAWIAGLVYEAAGIKQKSSSESYSAAVWAAIESREGLDIDAP